VEERRRRAPIDQTHAQQTNGQAALGIKPAGTSHQHY